MTEGEARERAWLLTDIAYDVFLDLAVTPARSRTRAMFRCRRPGADTFAQLGVAAARSPDGSRRRRPWACG